MSELKGDSQGACLLSSDWHVPRGQAICDVSQCCWTGGYRRSPECSSGDNQRHRPEHSKLRTLKQNNCEEWPLVLHNPADRIWPTAWDFDTPALHDGLRAFWYLAGIYFHNWDELGSLWGEEVKAHVIIYSWERRGRGWGCRKSWALQMVDCKYHHW